MSFMDRYWIVHNGEIYNYVELREELIDEGYEFCSQSDTEVIMAAYDKWGVECLSRFNGMWAFAIYDIYDNKLFVSRDRFGIKPLSFYLDDEKLVFASEIKALLKHSGVEAKPNIPHIQRFLKGHCVEYNKETAFENIWHFPAASFVEFQISAHSRHRFQPEAFWDCEVNLSNQEYDEMQAQALAGEYRDLLEDAVRLRLRADVKVGSAFSGGLDSSSIVYLVNESLRARNAEEKQQTFSTVFKSEEARHCDESEFINELTQELGIISNQIEPTAEMVRRSYKKMIYAMDTPQEDTHMAGMMTYNLISSSDVVVSIDGQGADELQAGYLPYLVNYFCNLPFARLLDEAKSFAQIPAAAAQIRLGIIFNLLRHCRLTSLVCLVLRWLGKFNNPFILPNQRLFNDLVGNLRNLFYFGDRVSMIHSLETRFPFMDYRVVEFWLRLPIVYKLHAGWTKYIARRAFEGRLPDKITWRKDKMGWETPQAHWLRVDLRDWVLNTINSSQFLAQLDVRWDVSAELEAAEASPRARQRILKLLNLAIWHETFFTEGNVKPAELQSDMCASNSIELDNSNKPGKEIWKFGK